MAEQDLNPGFSDSKLIFQLPYFTGKTLQIWQKETTLIKQPQDRVAQDKELILSIDQSCCFLITSSLPGWFRIRHVAFVIPMGYDKTSLGSFCMREHEEESHPLFPLVHLHHLEFSLRMKPTWRMSWRMERTIIIGEISEPVCPASLTLHIPIMRY